VDAGLSIFSKSITAAFRYLLLVLVSPISLSRGQVPLSLYPGQVLALFVLPEFNQIPNNPIVGLAVSLDRIQLTFSFHTYIDAGTFIHVFLTANTE